MEKPIYRYFSTKHLCLIVAAITIVSSTLIILSWICKDPTCSTFAICLTIGAFLITWIKSRQYYEISSRQLITRKPFRKDTYIVINYIHYIRVYRRKGGGVRRITICVPHHRAVRIRSCESEKILNRLLEMNPTIRVHDI